MQQITRIVVRRRSLSWGVPFTPARCSANGDHHPDGVRERPLDCAPKEGHLPAPTIDELTIADDPARWAALGFDVEDASAQIGSVWLRFAGAAPAPGAPAAAELAPPVPGVSAPAGPAPFAPGIAAWSLRDLQCDELDGLPTTISVSPVPQPAPMHPNGVVAIDHIVAASPDLDRSVALLQAAGMDLRRVREQPTPAGAPRQAFFRLGHEILELIQEPQEVVERAGGRDHPARFWGLALLVDDIDRCAEQLAGMISEVRPAVQPGRRIASVRRSAGLALPLALMSRDERTKEDGQ
jgi:catechol 2,3-dioxygenase-like lactoylglutathione lyase family enzyme